jgi:hypothetical protein
MSPVPTSDLSSCLKGADSRVFLHLRTVDYKTSTLRLVSYKHVFFITGIPYYLWSF